MKSPWQPLNLISSAHKFSVFYNSRDKFWVNKNRLSSTLLAITANDKIKEKFAKKEFNDLANEVS
jgi:hypothetical protein